MGLFDWSFISDAQLHQRLAAARQEGYEAGLKEGKRFGDAMLAKAVGDYAALRKAVRDVARRRN